MVTWHCHKILYLAFVVTSLTRFIHDETSPLFDAFGVIDVHADVGDSFRHLRVVVVTVSEIWLSCLELNHFCVVCDELYVVLLMVTGG